VDYVIDGLQRVKGEIDDMGPSSLGYIHSYNESRSDAGDFRTGDKAERNTKPCPKQHSSKKSKTEEREGKVQQRSNVEG